MHPQFEQRSQLELLHRDGATGSRLEFDTVVIGLNVQTLALTIALREGQPRRKLLILEQRSQEAWTPASNNASRMADSFLHDLITIQNPRSYFTFINYLHKTNQLIIFTNMSQIKPSREQFENYFRWVAAHFESQTLFQADISSINYSLGSKDIRNSWDISVRERGSSKSFHITSHEVILLTCPRPEFPLTLRTSSAAIVHAADFPRFDVGKFLRTKPEARVAIYGKDSQAASIYLQLQSVYGRHRATWINPANRIVAANGGQLSTDSFQSSTTNREQKLPLELRSGTIAAHTESDDICEISMQNFDDIYEKLYAQSIFQPDSSQWQFRIETGHELIGTSTYSADTISLKTVSIQTRQEKQDEYDLVISATGYSADGDLKMLAPIQELLDDNGLTVDTDYRVNLNKVKASIDLAMWCIGSLEPGTVPEQRMSILSERAKRVANSIRKFEQETSGDQQEKQYNPRLRL